MSKSGHMAGSTVCFRKAIGEFVPSRLVMGVCVLLALILGRAAHAQYVPFVHFAQGDGLMNLSVSELLQDEEGYLWIGTGNGLYRYNGTTFDRYGASQGLPSPEIRALALGPNHHLWVATPYAIYRFAGGRFVPIRPQGELSLFPGGSQIAFTGPGELLAASSGKLQRLRQDADGSWTNKAYFTAAQTTAKPELADIASIALDRQGYLWAGCGKSLCRVHDGIVDEYGPVDGVPAAAWLALHVDAAGRLWARSVDRIVSVDTVSLAIVSHDLPAHSITAVPGYLAFADGPDGDVLTRTDHAIARWHRDHWQFVEPLIEGQPIDPARVLMDHDGALWAGLFGRGLIRSEGYGLWESWTSREGLRSQEVWTITRARDGRLLVGHDGGVDELAKGAPRFARWQGTHDSDGLFQVLGIAQTADGSNWAAAADGGLYCKPPTSADMKKVASLAPIKGLLVDGEGTLWVATIRGVYALPNRPGGKLTALPGSGQERFRDLAMDTRGHAWGATNQGIFELRLDGQRKLAFPGDDALHVFSTLSFSPSGTLVVASKDQLLSLAVHDGHAAPPVPISSPLIDDVAVEFVRWDRVGRLWVGTDLGLAVRQQGKWRRFSQSDGLIWNDIDEHAFFADDDGSVWVGTSAGLSHLLNPAAALNSPALRASISSVVYGDARVPDGRSLPWSNKALSFEIANLSFARSGQVTFAMRLNGIDDGWSISATPRVSYAAIAPGDYRFEAYAVDASLGIRSPTMTYHVSIAPPWWRSSWFFALVIVGVLLVLLLTMRISVMIIVARHRRLEYQAMERRALIHRATHDALTGLLNRQSVLEHLDEVMRNDAPGAYAELIVALIDLDFFKQVNDTHGHLMGDKVLQQTGKALREKSRENDVVGRYGGEEFVWIIAVREAFDPQRLEQMRRHLATQLQVVDGRRIGVTASVGAARWRSGDTLETLLERVDRALYQAKDRGRNIYVLAEDGMPSVRSSSDEV